jgi:hypothetical protein
VRARLALLLLGVFALGAAGSACAQDYFIGPDELDLPSGGTLGTDGYGPYVDVLAASDQGCLAQTPVVLAGGRYRASWLIRTQPFGTSAATVRADIGFNGPQGWVACVREVTGPDLSRDGSVFPLSVEVTGYSLSTAATISYRNNGAGELETVRIYGLSFTRLDGGLALTKDPPAQAPVRTRRGWGG